MKLRFKMILIIVAAFLVLFIASLLYIRAHAEEVVKDKYGMINTNPSPKDGFILPYEAELISVFWSQSAMSMTDCFTFEVNKESIKAQFFDYEKEKKYDVGGENGAKLSKNLWALVDDYVRNTSFPLPKERNDEYFALDETESHLSITYLMEGERKSVSVVGNDFFLSMLKDIAETI